MIHRANFLYGIFILPICLFDRQDFKLICIAWLIAYVINATVNRLSNGYVPSKNTEYQPWLNLEKSSILSDIFRFRSEFSINTPGSHRQTFENFYPYFSIVCAIYIAAASIFPKSTDQISLDNLITSIDGSIINGIITYKNPDNPNACLPPSPPSNKTQETNMSSLSPDFS